MKDNLLKIYLLVFGVLSLILIASPVGRNARQLIDDEARLSSHYAGNIGIDTTITLINMADYPMDTIRNWVDRILKLSPKVLAIDDYSESAYQNRTNTGTIILPVITEDGEQFQFSENNFTTNQKHGVAAVGGYFRMQNYFRSGSVNLPSFAVQIIKEYDPLTYASVIEKDDALYNYLSRTGFRIIDFPFLYDDSLLAQWVKNKIVIIGYMGLNSHHIPGIFEHVDVHKTPVGKIFGPVVIANQIHTLMVDPITEVPNMVVVLISVIIFLSSVLLILKVRFRNPIVALVGLNITLIFFLGLITLISLLILDSWSVFLSIEIICPGLLMGFQGGIVLKLATFNTTISN